MLSSRLGWGALAALTVVGGALTAASCGDAKVVFPDQDDDGDGGGGSGSGGMGGASGGAGGTPPTCEEGCSDELPVCHDDECVEACPPSQDACQTSADADAAKTCCEVSEQCCLASRHGYPTDLCRPATMGCPLQCPDGITLCDQGTQCLYASSSDSWSCTDSCPGERSCGDQCCPLGSKCDLTGQCPLADLGIDVAGVEATISFNQAFFDSGACELVEGCIGDTGNRRLLRFSLGTPNTGAGDMFMGVPWENTELFEYSDCHAHYHFTGYADYRLLDLAGNLVATGHKQAFCLLDSAPIDPDDDPFGWVYDCEYQGIQSGWSDIYTSDLPCQWVDVTGVPAGNYQLEISLNAQKTLAESDYGNNMALVNVTVP